MTSNRTHRVRLARAYSAMAGIAYQPALSRVTAAAEAGLLPDQLDDAGLRNALDVLLTHPGLPDLTIDATGLPARYLRLSEVLRGPLPDVVGEAVSRARVAGILPVASYADWHPLDEADDDDGAGSVPDWWRRVLAAGRREEAEIPCPYPAGTVGEDGLPIDIALDTLEAGGDLDTYESTLGTISAGEPRDVDAHAHLGNLYWDMSSPRSRRITFATPPNERKRTAWLGTALEHYLSGAAIGELSLPDPFDGLLPRSALDNRPFLRALHGLALSLWRTRRYREAEAVLLNLLWLNPRDNQGARILLPSVRARRRWEDSPAD